MFIKIIAKIGSILLLTGIVAIGQPTLVIPINWSPKGPKNENTNIRKFIWVKGDPSKPHSALLASSSGLWYTQDVRNSPWTSVATEVATWSIAQDLNSPNVLYATNDGGGNYISTNFGLNWSLLDPINQSSGELIVNGNGDLFLYEPLSKRIQRFDVSLNKLVWTIDLPNDLPSEAVQKITDLAFDDNNHIYVTLTNGKIFKSSSSYGGGWTDISQNLPIENNYYGITNIAINKSGIGSTIYVIHQNYNGTESRWIKKSTDQGITWVDIVIPTNIKNELFEFIDRKNIQFNPLHANSISISTSNSLFFTKDFGIHWQSFAVNMTFSSYHTYLSNGHLINYSYSSLNYITDPFESNSILYKKEDGLLALRINDFQVGSNYDDTCHFVNNIPFHGVDTLVRSNIIWPMSSRVIIDSDDVNNSLLFYNNGYDAYDSLKIINSKGQNIKQLDLTFSTTNIINYEDKSNTFFSVLRSSQFYNNADLIRIRKIKSARPIIDTFKVGTYISNNHNFVALNDSTFLTYRFNELKKTVLKENGMSETYLLYELPGFKSNFKVSKYNPDFMIAGTPFKYSTDGGSSWNETGRSDTSYSVDFNELDPNHLFYSSNDHIYYTSNFLSTNPVWYTIEGNIPKNAFRYGQVSFRESDGMLYVESGGNGLFSTDYFSYLSTDSLHLHNYPRKVNNNEEIVVSFFKNGISTKENGYELWLSDENGSFSNTIKIGTSDTSPVIGCIPREAISSLNYKLLLSSNNLAYPIIQDISEPLEIGKFSYSVSDQSILVNKIGIIDSNAKVLNNSKTKYEAFNSVILLPNFESSPTLNGGFNAEIIGCQN